MTFEIGIVITIITLTAGLSAWIHMGFKRAKTEAKDETIELLAKDISTILNSMDIFRADVEKLRDKIDRHDFKIGQADIFLVHIDETMKQLSTAVNKLDKTLTTLQVTVAKIRD